MQDSSMNLQNLFHHNFDSSVLFFFYIKQKVLVCPKKHTDTLQNHSHRCKKRTEYTTQTSCNQHE